MNNRVELREGIIDSIERIPFLKRFVTPNNYNNDSLSSASLNEYMDGVEGWNVLTTHSPMQSADINMVLSEAEKRGDL